MQLSPRILSAPWQEASISVRSFDPIRTFLVDVGGYELVAEGDMAPEHLAYWRLSAQASASFVFLRAPGTDHGYIRLIKFEGVEQQPIRVGARAWDPGGYFSLMMRAKDLEGIYDKAIALGFQAESEPIRFLFEPTDGNPPSDLRNVVLKAPDGFVVPRRHNPRTVRVRVF
ncbi:MAG: hypothetical protein AAF337_14635 [Pseudomonadota bacterium]